MALLSLIRNWWQAPSTRELEALVKTIVDRCELAVWDRASERAAAMSPAEARGYIRARAATVVHLQVERALQLRSRTEPELHELLFDWVKRDVVRQIHRRLLNTRHAVVERRKAA
jgi:hypothetical protein